MGTPDFAGPSLSALVGSDDEVILGICQPDRPKGRGRSLSPPPSKVLAEQIGLPIWQPESIKTVEALSRLQALSPDLFVVVAFGQMLSPSLLALPRLGCLNVHPSLLPAYRGPAPINWAIINGDKETGVTTMLLDEGMDTGPIFLSRRVKIGIKETAGELHDRLAIMGADLLLETIAGLKAGTLSPAPQPEAGASVCRLLTKSDGLLDFSRTAVQLACQVRGMDPWPGAYSGFRGKLVKLFGAGAGRGRGNPGQVLTLDRERLHIAAGEGSLVVSELQVAGKKRQSAKDFWHGQRLSQTDYFGL